jgi:hypothetical protein
VHLQKPTVRCQSTKSLPGAATSFASAAASSCSGMPDTLAIRLKENSRPIAAPICATSFI